MGDQEQPNVGTRIRALREQQGLSLRALADRCGLSINAISMIERGQNSPTVASLHLLASALGVKIADFFEDPQERAVVLVRHDRRLRSQGNGWVMESLGIGLQNQQLEPFLITIEPGASNLHDAVTHVGQEFAHCLNGEVDYRVGSQIYHLLSGDSLMFDAAQPHGFSNTGDMPATLLLVFQTADGNIQARQRHLET